MVWIQIFENRIWCEIVWIHNTENKAKSLFFQDKKDLEDQRKNTNLFKTFIICTLYSVMQSDGNSFCRDVVLDSFNMANMDEDSILDQSMKSKHFKMLSSSRDALLKLSKTISLQKLFPSDCIRL